MSEKFTITVDMGLAHLPRPTGRWERDERGFWREVYTDLVVTNPDGSVRSRKPFKSLVGVYAEDGEFDERGPKRLHFRLKPRKNWRNLWGLLP